MPNLNIAFWVLTALASQLYVIAYLMLFVAVIYLRYKRPEVERTYKISQSNMGVWLISIVAILNALFALFVGFFPPSQIESGNTFSYILLTVLGIGIFGCVPFIVKEKETLGVEKKFHPKTTKT